MELKGADHEKMSDQQIKEGEHAVDEIKKESAHLRKEVSCCCFV